MVCIYVHHSRPHTQLYTCRNNHFLHWRCHLQGLGRVIVSFCNISEYQTLYIFINIKYFKSLQHINTCIKFADYKHYIFNRVGVYLSNTANCFSTVVSVNNFNSTTNFFQFKLLLLMLYNKRSLEVKSFDKLGKLQQNLQSFVSTIFTISF